MSQDSLPLEVSEMRVSVNLAKALIQGLTVQIAEYSEDRLDALSALVDELDAQVIDLKAAVVTATPAP
jgi:hypothetical protein